MCSPKIIYCGKCNRKVGTWDGKSTINVICVCKKCNKKVVYHVDNGTTEVKDRNPRPNSSSVNFSY